MQYWRKKLFVFAQALVRDFARICVIQELARSFRELGFIFATIVIPWAKFLFLWEELGDFRENRNV